MPTTGNLEQKRGGDLLLPLACAAGKTGLRLSRVLRRGSGSAFPGLVAERIDPGVLSALGRHLTEGCVLITGTNGKTTTAGMLRHILTDTGRPLVGNPSGSNLSRGIISALLQNASLSGRPRAPFAVLEVDEAALPKVAGALPTRGIVVLNLFRDQLDRYGEIDSLARVIASALPQAGTIYLNADDPLVASLGTAASATADVRYFGLGFDGWSPPVDDATPDAAHRTDSDRCPLCHTGLVYERVTLSHLGEYRCPRGDFARPALDLEARVLGPGEPPPQPLELRVQRHVEPLALRLPGMHNAYDAAAAAAVATDLGVPLEDSAASLARVSPAFGRGETFSLDGRLVDLLLVKNPASFDQVLLTLRGARHAPWLVLVNDNTADGTDVSWLWDVAFEQLRDSGVQVTCGGTRGLDLALRLKYAGVGSKVAGSLDQGLESLLAMTPPGSRGYIVATYTAMLQMRKLIGKRTKIGDFSR